MTDLKQALINQGHSEQEAENLIDNARTDLMNRLDRGEMPQDICMEHFGLEPDYMFDLMPI